MDPAEPDSPGSPQDDGAGSPPDDGAGSPPDDGPGSPEDGGSGSPPDDGSGPARNENEPVGPARNENEPVGPARNENEPPGPHLEPTPGPLPDQALGPLQYGDASSPQHKAPHEEPSSTLPIGVLPPPTNAGAKPPGGKRRRRKKILAWTSGALAAVVVVGGLGVYFVYRHLNSNLHQVDISGVVGSQPIDRHPQAENILVLGSDTRIGQGGRFGSSAVLNTDHSDTLMIVHIAANRQWADVMSIPRDSWVSIPSCQMGNGQRSSATTFKINEAFTLGTLDGNKTALGVACTVKTIEKNTGIRIDHFVVVNFTGFRDMVNAVGGVPECNNKPINDPLSGLHLSAGNHVLNGWPAISSGSAASRPSCPRWWTG
jgi:LCP family protein required for cell wall assembly